MGRRSRIAVATTYGAAFLQGLALVSFPASSSVLKGALGLSDAQYGSIFLPQVACAIAGALTGGGFARRLGLRAILVAALLATALSQLLLFASLHVAVDLRYGAVAAGTAALGLGFGLGGAPLNSYPALFFPRRGDTALVMLHTLLGLGLAVGPLLIASLLKVTLWPWFPVSLAALCVTLAAVTVALRLPAPAFQRSRARSEASPARTPAFWLFAAIAVVYSFAEGTFSNWAVVYLAEVRQLPAAVAAGALSLFWAALVLGRLLASVLVLRIAPARLWTALPLGMIAAFWLLPSVNTAATGLAAFALAGLACSAFFPLTIGLVSARFPADVAWVSSAMIAALLTGVGLGSFVIGPLRVWLDFESLYRLSSLYPAIVFALALLAQRRPRALPAMADL